MKFKSVYLTGVIAMLLCFACTFNNVEDIDPNNPPPDTTQVDPCDTMAVSFADTILPIVIRYCSDANNGSCHQTGATGKPPLTDYASVFGNLPGIEFRMLEQKSMPPIGSAGPVTVTACEQTLMQRWIDAGAPDN